MAQIYSVQLPSARPVTYLDPLNAPFPHTGARPVVLGKLPPLAPRESLALATLGAGLVSALGVYLFATGHKTEAYALAVAGGVTSAFIGAAKLLGDA